MLSDNKTKKEALELLKQYHINFGDTEKVADLDVQLAQIPSEQVEPDEDKPKTKSRRQKTK
jgi:hypothetical protein